VTDMLSEMQKAN